MSVSTAFAPAAQPIVSARPLPAKPRRGRRRLLLFIATLLVAGSTLWQSSHRVETGPAAGQSLSGAAQATVADATTLRVATFNIHGGKGHDDRRDLGRIAHEIERVDLIGLNEVEGAFLFERQTQVEQLADRLQLSWLFAPAERRWWHYEFGNGVLTRMPVNGWERIPLPRTFGKGFRNLVLLRSNFGGKPLNVVITHIDRSDNRERAAQVRFVADYFLALAEPALLMGDLNTDANDAELRRLLDSPGVVDSLSQIAGVSRHIDWILVRGLVVRDSGMREVGASDHPALWAELELPPEK